jgi:hypothetical protein
VSISITDEIIDAIIQNERRHVGRPRKPLPSAWVPETSWNLAFSKQVVISPLEH